MKTLESSSPRESYASGNFFIYLVSTSQITPRVNNMEIVTDHLEADHSELAQATSIR